MEKIKWNYIQHIELTKVAEIKDLFDSKKLIGKKIIDINIIGELKFKDKHYMVDFYNNSFIKKDELSRKKVFEEDIPLDAIRRRAILFDGLVELYFDDGTYFYIGMKDFGIFCYGNKKIEHNLKRDVDYNRIFSIAINNPIKEINVKNYEENDGWDMEIKGLSKNEIVRYIEIIFEDDMLLRFDIYNLFTFSKNESDDEKCWITMKEFKECVSFYSELFSKHEENEEYDDIYITPKKKLKNILDASQEEQDLWFVLKECGVKIMDINHYLILFNMLNIDKKHSFLCELAEKIEENKDEIITTDFVLRRLLAYINE